MAIFGYPVTYNGVSIQAASPNLHVTNDYGIANVKAIRIIETLTVTGIITSKSELDKLRIPGRKLTFKIGGEVWTRTALDDIEGGPKPEVTANKMIGQGHVEITLKIIITRSAGFYSALLGNAVEINVEYTHDIDDRKLSTWTTQGFVKVADGNCADELREDIVREFAGNLKEDFVRKAQIFGFSEDNTRMSFTIRDEESFHKPAHQDVQFSTFKLSATTDGLEVIKTCEVRVQPHKDPYGIGQAKDFAETAIRELLLGNVEGSYFLDSSNISSDSETGEIIVTASIKVILTDVRLINDPKAADIIHHLWWGITTTKALTKFIAQQSRSTQELPRGYAGLNACAKVVPKLRVLTIGEKLRKAGVQFVLWFSTIHVMSGSSFLSKKEAGLVSVRTKASHKVDIRIYMLTILDNNGKITEFIHGDGQKQISTFEKDNDLILESEIGVRSSRTKKRGTSQIEIRFEVRAVAGTEAQARELTKLIVKQKDSLEKSIGALVGVK